MLRGHPVRHGEAVRAACSRGEVGSGRARSGRGVHILRPVPPTAWTIGLHGHLHGHFGDSGRHAAG